MSGFWRADAWERVVLDDYCLIGGRVADPDRLRGNLTRIFARRADLESTLRRHKAFTFFAARLAELDRVCEFPGELMSGLRRFLEPELRACGEHRSLLTREFDALLRMDAPAAAGIIAIKGFSNIRFYADRSARWSRDVDVFVPAWADASNLVGELRSLGYAFDPRECPWFKADFTRDRKEYGQVILAKEFGADFCRIDIHFGTYSSGFDRYLALRLEDFAEVTGDGAAAACLNATGTLLVMFAHALSDGYVSVKDVNDAAALALSGSKVDWARLAAELTRHSLEPQARLLARHLLTRYDQPGVAGFARRLGAAAQRGPRLFWQVHNRNWRRRALVNAAYTLRSGLASGRSQPRAAWRSRLRAVWKSVQCFAFYVRRLQVSYGRRTLLSRLLLALIPKTDVSQWRLRPDVCTMLVHTRHPALLASPGLRFTVGAAGFAGTPAAGIRIDRASPSPRLAVIHDDAFLVTWDLHIDAHRGRDSG